MSETTELAVVPPKETALAVFTADKGLEPWLQQIRAEVDKFQQTLPELTTAKGRERYASMAYKIAKSKTALDAVGKQLSAEQKEVPKKIDAERKRVWDTLELWQEEVRKPLNDWEEADRARVAGHKQVIAWLESFMPQSGLGSAELQMQIDEVSALEINAALQEFEADTARAKDAALTALRARLEERLAHEAEQRELNRLREEAAERERVEREARIAREATERAEREAEQKAQTEREATAKREADAKAAADLRELELKLRAEESQRREQEAEQRAQQATRDAELKAEQAAQAERQRQADKIASEQAAVAAREADTKHKAAINREAMAAFMVGGMTEECAKQAVTLIARRAIPHIAITY